MKPAITRISMDSLRFITSFFLGAAVYAYFGVGGLIAGAVSIMLLNYVVHIWSKRKQRKSSVKEVKKK